MKYIKLTTTTIDVNSQSIPFDYHKAIYDIVKIAPEGLDIDNLKKRLRILDSLERAGEYLILEDSDYNLLCDLVQRNKWNIVAKEIVDFCEAIKNAPSAIPKEKSVAI